MSQAGDLLRDVLHIVSEREADYGPPAKHWALTCALINDRFGTGFQPDDWGIMVILDKIARDAHTKKVDNLADIAGYADGIARVRDGC